MAWEFIKAGQWYNQAMLAYYDTNTLETIVVIDELRLTIPDYMRISDIVSFIEDKLFNSAMRALNEATYDNEQESPLDKAMAHYKNLGWFRDETQSNATEP